MENNSATQVERPLGQPESMTEMNREGIAEIRLACGVCLQTYSLAT